MKTYYICKRWKSNCIEVVHPRQLRNSDKVLLHVESERWWDFEQILFKHKMNPNFMHYKKVIDLWERYCKWISK